MSACIAGRAGISIPIVGGVSIEFEACFGSPSWYSFDLTGTGFLRRIQFHRRGSTGAEPLTCVGITDQDPASGSGQRTFNVESSECCEEDVGVEWEGDFDSFVDNGDHAPGIPGGAGHRRGAGGRSGHEL